MKLFPNMSTVIEIGPLSIQWYAVFIVGGAYLALYLSARSFKKTAHPYELMSDLFFGIMISGVIGARLWYVLFSDLAAYLQDPIRILMTREGGLAVQGGLMAGILYSIWFAKRHRIDFFRLADMVLPHVLLAQAIGRLGNFTNQEAFGRVVSESYFNGWPAFIKDNMFIGGEFREPTFLYETLACIIGWLIINYGIKKFNQYKRGDLAYAYLMWYGVSRFIIEGFRSDSLMYEGLRTAQLVSIAFLLVGLMGWFGIFRKLFKKKPVILFDFDGTLADTQELILETFRTIFRKHLPDYELTIEDEMKWIGPTLKESLSRYFEEDQVESLIEEYGNINKEIHEKYIKPINHAEELLTSLKEEGYTLGLVSSKSSSAVALGNEILGFSSYFDVVICLDNVEHHKPHPEGILKACDQLKASYDDVIYVGDSVTDVEAGKNAYVYTIGLVFEEKRKQILLDSKPNQVIHDLLEIKEILKGEHGWTSDLT